MSSKGHLCVLNSQPSLQRLHSLLCEIFCRSFLFSSFVHDWQHLTKWYTTPSCTHPHRSVMSFCAEWVASSDWQLFKAWKSQLSEYNKGDADISTHSLSLGLPAHATCTHTCKNCHQSILVMFSFLLKVSGASYEVFIQRVPSLAPAGPVTHGSWEGELISPYIPATCHAAHRNSSIFYLRVSCTLQQSQLATTVIRHALNSILGSDGM